MHFFLYRNDQNNLFNFGSCLATKTDKTKSKRLTIIPQKPSTSKCLEKPSGPRLRLENMSLMMDFCFKQGALANVYGSECVLPRLTNMKKLMMINWKSFCAVRYMFKSMKCEVYAPLEGHYARKRQPGRLLFYRPNKNPAQILRISLSYDLLDFLYRLHFIKMPIQRFVVESYTTQKRIEEFVSLFGETVEELVWKSNDIKRALKFISSCAQRLRYLECDINLLESPDFPHLKLNQFKSIKVKANSDQTIPSLLKQEVKHVDLSDLSSSDGGSFSQSLLRQTPSICPQNSLESASLGLQVCQSTELLAKIQVIKQFAPNLKQVEFVRNINGIEFDSDLSQFIFLEVEQIHDAVRSAQVKDIELSVRCVYSLQPEECFSFRANASLAVICSLEKAELIWRPPRSSTGKQMLRRREVMAFNNPTKTFRSEVHKFIKQMEVDYRRAECY